MTLKIAVILLRMALAYLIRKQEEMSAAQKAEIKAIMDQSEGERWYEKARRHDP